MILCKDCIFFDDQDQLYVQLGTKLIVGVCHRYPPATKRHFPRVNEGEWCGEAKLIPEAVLRERKRWNDPLKDDKETEK